MERVRQGKENDRIHSFKRSFWLLGGEWAGAGHEWKSEDQTIVIVAIIQVEDAGSSDQGGSHGLEGFLVHFKIRVMGLAV